MGASEAIAGAIRDRGPITFAEFMDLALYAPGGFYDRPPIGAGGDFVTSPHVHEVFGLLLAGAVDDLHGRLGRPRPFTVAEVGAGDGTLARQMLPHLAPLEPTYVAVERSRGARDALTVVDGVTVADRLTGAAHVIVANELLDNLPFRLLRGTSAGPREVRVDIEDGRFRERLTDPTDVDDAEGLDDGEERVVPVGALAFLDEVAARLADPGYALLIDYGGVGEPGGPVHGYRGGRPVEDILERPGSSDVTAGVDFARIAARAERLGLTAFPTVTQRHALTSLGLDRWIRDELVRQTSLLADRRGAEAVRVWSGRSRATLLVDPTGLGRLRWLLLARPGLSPPPWL